MFGRRLPFHLMMQQAEARKWLHSKESFDQYAIDKLTLLHGLDLPEMYVIDLLIGGISISSLCATALAIPVTTCTNCNRKGHVAKDCRSSTVIILLDVCILS
ncbi:uncharacterized protein LOC105182416 [Harpegnathos saltator]|uniref:uncharacterized protein LOC105182416 n=1 Tax=Harpegnathos saltator TaxID=610380 RepID=UPI000DBEDA45|nr:uncharacterized protein LOC105182416 [Harpegnathos saltator]